MYNYLIKYPNKRLVPTYIEVKINDFFIRHGVKFAEVEDEKGNVYSREVTQVLSDRLEVVFEQIESTKLKKEDIIESRDKIRKHFEDKGYFVSVTKCEKYGLSAYAYVLDPSNWREVCKIRVSDHSVTSQRRMRDEVLVSTYEDVEFILSK
mgnify:FL=1